MHEAAAIQPYGTEPASLQQPYASLTARFYGEQQMTGISVALRSYVSALRRRIAKICSHARFVCETTGLVSDPAIATGASALTWLESYFGCWIESRNSR